ncbi:ATP-binding protein [Candidatus Micrarchaeota archaeon]|nr:ATP-binding protein [Candidatus Micrarchaeota archaeon]
MDLDNTGKEVGQIPVHLHSKILELFSANLYSSPNKAFEELVSNSYDAYAKIVSLYVPPDMTIPNAAIWVCDNGTGMDNNGLIDLWVIGESKKRNGKINEERPPIGKFGIGKLATFVLSRKLTHITKTKDKFLAVTMDYNRLQTTDPKGKQIFLSERELSEEEVIKLLSPIIIINGQNMVNFDLWGKNASDSWTMAIMYDLTPKAQTISEGRLKWVLSTALPLNPNFNLYYNGNKLESSKMDVAPLKKWVIGEDDKIVKDNNTEYSVSTWNDKPCINLPHLNNVRGQIELYEESLLRGKSQETGRSHGIFLMVRGRLININEPLVGTMEALHHATFNRMRFIVHADELDATLTSGRESVATSPGLSDLQTYLQRKFNEVRSYLMNYFEKEEKSRNPSYKLARTSVALSRRPLVIAVRKFFNGEVDDFMFTKIPGNLTEVQKQTILDELERELFSEDGIIKEVEIANLGSEKPIAEFNLVERKIKLNQLHPFVANFATELQTFYLPLKLIAANEILTEAFMIEMGIDSASIRQVMGRRDELLRELTYSDNPNTVQVAMRLKDSIADEEGLEDAVYHAFNNLGFQTTKIGGNGNPDGEAKAYLREDGVKKDFSLTYDAKSTKKKSIKAKDASLSANVKHRNAYNANYSVVVAIDYEGATESESSINKEAKIQKVSVMRASDLRTLVLLAGPREVNLAEMKQFLETCHTVLETSAWIESVKNRVVKPKPIKELLETTMKLSREDPELPYLSAIRVKNPILERYSLSELRTLVKSLESIVGHMISINERDVVSIQSSPEKIIQALDTVVRTVPPELMEDYIKAFETKTQTP